MPETGFKETALLVLALILRLPDDNCWTLQPMNDSGASNSADSEEENREEEVPVKTPPKQSGGGSKTLFVKNLAWAADQDKV